MKSIGTMLSILILLSSLAAKNLKILKTVSPFNYEQIDVEIDGNRMIIPAGLGGAEIYDISDPKNPQSIGNIELFNCRWGRTYNWDLFKDYAIGTARECGFAIYNIANPARPQLLAFRNANDDFDPTPGRQGGASLEDVEVHKNTAIFAAHAAGLVFYDIDPLSSPIYLGHLKTTNAWSLAIDATNDFAFVADGDGGIKVINIRNPKNPSQIGSAPTSGTARDIRIHNNYLFVAVGAAGIDVFDIGSPSMPRLVDNFPTTGFTSRVAVHGDLVSLSSWDRLHVLRFQNDQLELVGYKNTGGRLMAVGTAGGKIIYGAEWEALRVYEYGEINAPDIDLSSRALDFKAQIGASETLPLTIENNGGEPLNIPGMAFSDDDYTTPQTTLTIAPRNSKTIDITYTPTRSSAAGNVLFFTNDPDEEELYAQLRGNNACDVQEGDVAPGFNLPVIANGSGLVSLDELQGRVVVLAIFASW